MKKILSLVAAAAMAFSANAALSTTDFSSNNYIQEWGRLKLVGNQLSSEKGEAIQLKGWSTFGNYTQSCFKSSSNLDDMKAWGANIIRLAQYPRESQKFTMDQIKDYIDATQKRGMYVLVDWHVLKTNGDNGCSYCGNPKNLKDDAKSFFREIAQYVQQKSYKHVLYEICNEPDQGIWGDIKPYAEEMIDLIAQYDQGAVVIVGTPSWSQDIYSVAYKNMISTPYTQKAQVMYSFHLYANYDDHIGRCFEKEFKPACKVMPVFVSEWGMSSAQPELLHSFDDYSYPNSKMFWNAMGGQYGQLVSWCNWSYGNKQEGSSSFQSGCNQDGLSQVGKYVIEFLGGNPDTHIEKGTCYTGDCFEFNSSLKNKNFGVELFNNGGEAVAYHDCNDTDEETETQPTLEGEPGCQAATAAGYCTFRSDECVDISDANGFGTGYNLGWMSEGEWLRYTVEVTDPGYYYVEIGINEKGLTGAITFEDVDAQELITSDIDASTNTENVPISQIYANATYDPSTETEVNGWINFGFAKPCEEEEEPGNYGICLKEAGQRTIQMSFPEGMSGDLGSLRFTYVKPYTGEGYKNDVEVKEITNPINVTIYPTIATEQIYVNVPVSKIEIVNLVGEVLISSEEGQTVKVAELAKGSYIAKAYTKSFGIISKQFIKK